VLNFVEVFVMHRIPTRRQFVKHTALLGAYVWTTGRCRSAGTPDSEQLPLAEFAKLHRELQPPKDEPWRTIPWKMSIADACRLASKEKKPLVMRVRSGHPLGCV
jgi:hypothetical protein